MSDKAFKRVGFVGDAGEHLVKAHLNAFGIEAGIVNGREADVVANIGGIWRTFQVKSSGCGRFFAGARFGSDAPIRKLSDYDVDAFVFCYLPSPYPRYIAKVAIGDSVSFAPADFTRAARDSSFDDLLERWGLPSIFELRMCVA